MTIKPAVVVVPASQPPRVVPPLPSALPLSLDERVVAHAAKRAKFSEPEGGDPALNNVRQSLREMREALGKAIEAARTIYADASVSSDGNHRRVSHVVEKLSKAGVDAGHVARSLLDAIEADEREIAEALATAPEMPQAVAIAAEVRALVRSMKPSERLKFVRDEAARARWLSVAALIAAPPLTWKGTDEELEQLREVAVAICFPQRRQRIAALRTAYERLLGAEANFARTLWSLYDEGAARRASERAAALVA